MLVAFHMAAKWYIWLWSEICKVHKHKRTHMIKMTSFSSRTCSSSSFRSSEQKYVSRSFSQSFNASSFSWSFQQSESLAWPWKEEWCKYLFWEYIYIYSPKKFSTETQRDFQPNSSSSSDLWFCVSMCFLQKKGFTICNRPPPIRWWFFLWEVFISCQKCTIQ